MAGRFPKLILMSLPRAGLLGGPSTHLPLLYKGISELGVEVIPFNFTRRAEVETKWRKILDRSLDLFHVVKVLIARRPDIIHHNSAFDPGTFTRDALLCLIAKLFRTPIFIKIHGSHRESFGRLGGVSSLARNLVIAHASGLGVLSKQEREEFKSTWPETSEKIFVVKNVIRPEFLSARVESNSRPMIFFASRFMRKKGIFDLLEAIPGILSSHPDCRFTFVGDGPDVDLFLKKVAELQLSDSVTYLPNKTYLELIELYVRGGIFVFPTHFPEGMPMAMVEAMAVGLTVVSAPVRFVQDIPSFSERKLLLLDGESYSVRISEIINRIVSDVSLRTEVGLLNKSAAANYSEAQVARDFLEVYGEILA